MKRRATKIGILGAAICALLVWMGCAGAFMDKRGATGSTCTRDTDCLMGFCDLGACVALSDISNLGAACDSVPPALTPQTGQLDPVCGGFLCVKGRCRSCRSDAECESYLGAGKCSSLGHGEGLAGSITQACWLKQDSYRYHHAIESTSGLACANIGPDVPVDQRLAAGKTCARDCDCRSGLCDRGTCAYSVDIGAWSYGDGFCEPTPPMTPADLGLLGSRRPRNMCQGYICIDHRCRSCVSDAECQAGSSEYRCLPLYGLPGKRCGRPSEAEAGPARDRRFPTYEEIDEQIRRQDFGAPSGF